MSPPLPPGLTFAAAPPPTDDAGFLQFLVDARNFLATEVRNETLWMALNGARPTYSLDGRSVQWDEWLRTRTEQIKALQDLIVSLDTPWEVHVRAWAP